MGLHAASLASLGQVTFSLQVLKRVDIVQKEKMQSEVEEQAAPTDDTAAKNKTMSLKEDIKHRNRYTERHTKTPSSQTPNHQNHVFPQPNNHPHNGRYTIPPHTPPNHPPN